VQASDENGAEHPVTLVKVDPAVAPVEFRHARRFGIGFINTDALRRKAQGQERCAVHALMQRHLTSR